MTRLFLPFAAISFAATAHAAPSTSIIPTKNGPIKITAKFHASTQIEYRGKVIIVDPVSAASWTKKADVILITHPHPDHLDLVAIAKLKKSDTEFLAPYSLTDSIRTLKITQPESVGTVSIGTDYSLNWIDKKEVVIKMMVHAVPMYNLVRGPKPGQKFHPKSDLWTGYVLTLGGKRIYFAGDTEATPEMKSLKNIDAAFLPMNLPFTMTPQEAANAAKAFKPKRVYPYHYRYPFDKDSGNERTFARLMKGSRTKVVLLDWYPTAAVKKMMAGTKK